MSSIPARRLPPSQVDCKWWMQGYCRRGKSCHFKHDEATAGVQNIAGRGGESATPTSLPESASSIPSQQTCAICFGSPDTYGLLINCDHAFCLECIRTWRSTAQKSSEKELKKTSKTCPMCRSHSDFIIPSTFFPTLENAKTGVVERYLSRLKTIPCRYFQQSIKDSAAPEYKFKCQFGNSCHYSHEHPITKEPYTFSQDELDRMKRKPRRSGRARMLDDMAIMEMLFADLSTRYNEHEESGSEIQDRDTLSDIMYEPDYLEMSFDDFEEFGGFDEFDEFDNLW